MIHSKMKMLIFVHSAWVGLSSQWAVPGWCSVMYAGSYSLLLVEILIKASPQECPSGSASPNWCENRQMAKCHQGHYGVPLIHIFLQDCVVIDMVWLQDPSVIISLTLRADALRAGEKLSVTCLTAHLFSLWFTAPTRLWLWKQTSYSFS